MTPIPVLITVGGLRVGGAERMLVSIVNGLDTSRFWPTVLSLSAENPLAQQVVNAEVVSAPRRYRFDLRPAQKIRDIIENKGIRSILCFDTFDFFFVRVALRLLRMEPPKIVVSMHRTGPEGVKDYLQTLFYARLLDGAQLVSVSNQQAVSLARRYMIRRDRFQTIYNGVDVQHFDPSLVPEGKTGIRRRLGIPEGCRVVLQVANLGVAKRHEDSIAALHILTRKRPALNAVLVLAGESRDGRQEVLRSLSRKLGLENDIFFLGPQGDVRSLYHMADCFTLSSTTEALPLSALEAMAMGLPCVLTDVGGASEIVRDGIDGFVVPVRDAEALAEKWSLVLDSRHKFSPDEIRQHVLDRFSIERCVREYERLFLE